ncbi:unnamed protein product [Timema podura]|uniref:Alpha galactosidase A C-terminal domain-containing protein n=1 Tax=Timema podura TaxID=61482 RepID=A0ABN7NU85_TIMPD|nr:unnamed protein product [Timema podura]
MHCSRHLLRHRLPSSRIKTKLKLRMCEELDTSCNATVITVVGNCRSLDNLIIGDYGLSYEQSKTQMAVWAILAAPLLLSTDIAAVKKPYKEILQNTDILAVNQDPLGIQGKRVYMDDSNTTHVWTRAISPKQGDQFSYAVALVSRRTDGIPHPFSVSLEEIGLNNTAGYHFKISVMIPEVCVVIFKALYVYVKELYTGETFTLLSPQDEINPIYIGRLGGGGLTNILLENDTKEDRSTLQSDLEEADERLLLHVHHAVARNVERIVIASSDTDVFVCALYHFFKTFKRERLSELWALCGKCIAARAVLIHKLLEVLEHSLIETIPALHSIIGCDTTSKFGTKLTALKHEGKEGFGNQINPCQDRGLNPGTPAQKSDTLTLDHQGNTSDTQLGRGSQYQDGLRVDFFEREWMTREKNHQVEVLHLPPMSSKGRQGRQIPHLHLTRPSCQQHQLIYIYNILHSALYIDTDER